MQHWRHQLMFTILFFASGVVYAADADIVGTGSGRAALIQTALGLVVVIAVIYALAWLAKRTNLGALGRDKGLKVLVVLPLGPREKAILVDIAGTQMLLGVAPGRVSTLHVFPKPVIDQEPIKPHTSSLSASTASEFSKKLNDFLGQGNRQP
jgi:flagellar protein FliO/FliZ